MMMTKVGACEWTTTEEYALSSFKDERRGNPREFTEEVAFPLIQEDLVGVFKSEREQRKPLQKERIKYILVSLPECTWMYLKKRAKIL